MIYKVSEQGGAKDTLTSIQYHVSERPPISISIYVTFHIYNTAVPYTDTVTCYIYVHKEVQKKFIPVCAE